jgi:DNA mismatch endonuclease, patch repair protein
MRVAEYPHPSSAGRSANMRANRRTDTKPELALRRALHRQGYRFRKDYRLDLADGKRVRPDIAFTARRVAVFVDGCFWHACPEHGSRPAANVWYWEPKLRRNVERDRAADAALAAAGWNVVRVWEHETLDAAVTAVLGALASSPWSRARDTGPDGSIGAEPGASAAGAEEGEGGPGRDAEEEEGGPEGDAQEGEGGPEGDAQEGEGGPGEVPAREPGGQPAR